MTEKSSNDISFDCLDYNYKKITAAIEEAAIKSGRQPQSVSLMAVTKTVQPVFINRAISLGAKLIGENKVQELLSKQPYLNLENTDVHIIGHLQSNKVKKIVGVVSAVQSLDSISLANEISLRAQNADTSMNVLLEINIGNEEAKTGFTYEEAIDRACEISEMRAVNVKGFMAVPPVCENDDEARVYFEKMKRLFEEAKSKLKDKADISVLSMGMSADFVPAILEGSTLVRVGSALFGARRY